jgi:hypothetical protein
MARGFVCTGRTDVNRVRTCVCAAADRAVRLPVHQPRGQRGVREPREELPGWANSCHVHSEVAAGDQESLGIHVVRRESHVATRRLPRVPCRAAPTCWPTSSSGSCTTARRRSWQPLCRELSCGAEGGSRVQCEWLATWRRGQGACASRVRSHGLGRGSHAGVGGGDCREQQVWMARVAEGGRLALGCALAEAACRLGMPWEFKRVARRGSAACVAGCFIGVCM